MESRDHFATTRWSLVLAVTGPSEQKRAALEELIRIYWFPVFALARRLGLAILDAEDATQGFFADLLARDSLAGLGQDRGRLRGFLIGAFRNFVANERDRAAAAKRGGGAKVVAVDFDSTAADLRFRSGSRLEESADRAFDRDCALAVLAEAIERVRAQYATRDQRNVFEVLKPALVGDGLDYGAAARALETSESTVRVAVHRLRSRYRDALRGLVADSLSDPKEVDVEIRALIAAISR
jgi:DNA-directed RNA polymerase specialized sigma24 family protein